MSIGCFWNEDFEDVGLVDYGRISMLIKAQIWLGGYG